MFLQVLDFAMSIVRLAFVIVYVIASIRVSQTVQGSYPRYAASTVRIVAAIGVVITSLGKGSLSIMLEQPISFGLDALLLIIYVWLAYRAYNDDDNWFNKQGKRLRRGIKRLRQRLANTAPLPLPSPT